MNNNFMKSTQKYCHVVFLFLFLSLGTIVSQNRQQVTGVVKTSDNEPLIGATVNVRGKQVGTVTDIKGQYQLRGIDPNDVLLFSYVGMKNVAIQVSGRTQINVTLEEDVQILDEVVAVGYGSMRKSDLTGTVKSISATSFSEDNIQTVEQALKGRVAGVKVVSDNAPGGGISIQIRGTNSMLGGTEPLYVVDGFPVEPSSQANGGVNTAPSQSSLNFLNPDDIESIEVLKDASATAIYGARGSNGVVLITTKSGNRGQVGITNVYYKAKFGMSEVSKKINVLDEEGFANYMNQRELNRYYIESEAVSLGYLMPEKLKPIELPYGGLNELTGEYKPLPWELRGTGTDWQNSVYQPAWSNNHTLQIEGRNEKTNFFISAGYIQQNGIILNTEFKRYSINSKLEHKIGKSLIIRNQLNISRTDSKGGSVSTGDVFQNRSVVSNALWYQPVYKFTDVIEDDADDEFGLYDPGMKPDNPYLLSTLLKDDIMGYTTQNIMSADGIINKYLTTSGKFAILHVTSSRSQYWPMTTQRAKGYSGQASLASNDKFKYLFEGRLNYKRKFFKIHTIDLMGAVSFEETTFKNNFQRVSGFPNDILGYHGINSATTVYNPVVRYNSSRIQSFISRVNYNYRDRYLLTTTFRIDGSSRAAKNVKYGFFQSVAGAWRISQEPFMPKTDMLTNLKLRISYGSTGNEPNQPYQSLPRLDPSQYPFDNIVNPGYYESNMGNEDLTWERTNQYNLGLDFSVFMNKVHVTLDLYSKMTTDLLQMVKLPPSSGFPERLMNLGEVENKGFEFEVNVPLISKKTYKWDVFVNGGINRNKLVSLGNRDYIAGDQISGGIVPNRFIVGQPLGVFYGYKTIGVFKDWDQIRNSPEGEAQRNATPGEYIYANLSVDYELNEDGSFKLDENGNKIPDKNQILNADDYTIIGDPNPDFTFGFGMNLQIKKFDFSVLFSGQLGGDIYWVDYGVMTNMWRNYNMYEPAVQNAWIAPLTYDVKDKDGNVHTIGSAEGNINGTFPRALNWDKESARPYSGDVTKIERYRNDVMNSSMVHDATHLKIQNLSMGYNFPKILGVQNIRVSLSASNLITLTKYPGYDPELTSFSSPTKRGIDFGSYPATRSYMLNVNIKF